MDSLRVIDSHTGGEPTRLVIEGLPEALTCPTFGSVAERARQQAPLFSQLSGALCGEPRGSAVMVGAALVEPADESCALGLIFFNNVGTLGMCGHGTIGALASLGWLGLCQPGPLRVETPVGVVQATLHTDRRVSFENVPSSRYRARAPLQALGRTVHGDIAWGGNWFFLVSDHGQDFTRIEDLHRAATAIRAAIDATGLRGDPALQQGLIDHIELVGPGRDGADATNFVLCPGGEYDRSPCGTGTSAKLACLAAEGRLAPGQLWRQRSVVGSVFEGRYRAGDRPNTVIPEISGRAFITADSRVVFEPEDPFAFGLPAIR